MRAITLVLTIVLGAIAVSGCSSNQSHYKKYTSKPASEYRVARLPVISPTNVSGWDRSPKTFSSNSYFKTVCSNNPYGKRCELEKSWQKHEHETKKMWAEFMCTYGSRCWKQKNNMRAEYRCSYGTRCWKQKSGMWRKGMYRYVTPRPRPTM
jgi:hypothetical protein